MTQLVTRPLALKDFKPKQNKFGNRKVEYKGMKFDSVLERDRWIVLEAAQARGEIGNLMRQVRYPLEVEGHLIAFCYRFPLCQLARADYPRRCEKQSHHHTRLPIKEKTAVSP